MTDDLTKQLKELVRQDTMAYELDEKVAEITQAFIDAGWQPVTVPVIYPGQNVKAFYFDPSDKNWKSKPDTLMTGQEWYDKFIGQFKGVPSKTLITIDTEEIYDAAKKASGLTS